jgi:hypothetical protein
MNGKECERKEGKKEGRKVRQSAVLVRFRRMKKNMKT